MNLNYQSNVQSNLHQGIWQRELYRDDVFYDISTEKSYVEDNELEKNIDSLKEPEELTRGIYQGQARFQRVSNKLIH